MVGLAILPVGGILGSFWFLKKPAPPSSDASSPIKKKGSFYGAFSFLKKKCYTR